MKNKTIVAAMLSQSRSFVPKILTRDAEALLRECGEDPNQEFSLIVESNSLDGVFQVFSHH